MKKIWLILVLFTFPFYIGCREDDSNKDKEETSSIRINNKTDADIYEVKYDNLNYGYLNGATMSQYKETVVGSNIISIKHSSVSQWQEIALNTTLSNNKVYRFNIYSGVESGSFYVVVFEEQNNGERINSFVSLEVDSVNKILVNSLGVTNSSVVYDFSAQNESGIPNLSLSIELPPDVQAGDEYTQNDKEWATGFYITYVDDDGNRYYLSNVHDFTLKVEKWNKILNQVLLSFSGVLQADIDGSLHEITISNGIVQSAFSSYL